MPPASHVLLLPDVVFLIFEQLSVSQRRRARLVCRTWNGVYVSLKGTLVVWSPTTLDGDGIVRELEESLSKSPAPLTAVDLRLPDYPLGLNNEQRHFLEADLGELFDKALSSLLACQAKRRYGFRLARLRIGGWMECLLTPLPNYLSRLTRTRSLETLELLVPHAGTIDLMAVLSALPQLRTIHLSATDVSSWLNCTIESASDPSTDDDQVNRCSLPPFRLERLLVSNFLLSVEDLLKILGCCPKLEALRLVGSLTGFWEASSRMMFAAYCARLRYLHVTPSIKEHTIESTTSDFQNILAGLAQLERLGTVYQAARLDSKLFHKPRRDTLSVIQETMLNLTWLYLTEPSWTKPTACESILPFLREMPQLEHFYAPYSFVDMDQVAITRKHRRHVEPWVSRRLKVLDLGLMNTLYGGSGSWMQGEHHPALRTRDIFEFIGRTMPNLVHLRLRLSSGMTLRPDGGMHYLSWLEKLETLVMVMRTVAAPVDEWMVGTFEWLGQPPTSAPEAGSVFYAGARKPKSKMTTKVKSWLAPFSGDATSSSQQQQQEHVVFPTSLPLDCALPNLKRLHVQRIEPHQGGQGMSESGLEMAKVERYLRELRKENEVQITAEDKRGERSNMIFHRPRGNVIVSREHYDE